MAKESLSYLSDRSIQCLIDLPGVLVFISLGKQGLGVVMERDPVLFAQNERTPIIMPSICNHDPLEDTVQTTVFLTRLAGAGKNTVLNSQLLWLLFS